MVQTVSLTGGAQDDFLDASNFSGNAILRGSGGSDLLWGGAGNDILVGGDGHDWLDGGAGNDLVQGGSGNDVLIGGEGSDRLTSWITTPRQPDSDLLIGASFKYGKNHLVIDEILAVWAYSPESYDQRVHRLKNQGVGENKLKVNQASILEDQAADILFGGQDQDWFWNSQSDPARDSSDANAEEIIS
jgi:Ca2+-binding RTX toxin-like protein